MENAVDALKLACAVMMFVMALTLSISSFSQANSAVQAIISMRDRETEYTYVESSGLTRTVGVDAIVPTMYKSFKENIEIRFYADKNGTPLPVYYELDQWGKRIDEINIIDLNSDSIKFGTEGTTAANEKATQFLDTILSPYSSIDSSNEYKEMIFYENGFYEFLSDKKFIENLGEYYQSNSDGNKTKKRIITYTLVQ